MSTTAGSTRAAMTAGDSARGRAVTGGAVTGGTESGLTGERAGGLVVPGVGGTVWVLEGPVEVEPGVVVLVEACPAALFEVLDEPVTAAPTAPPTSSTTMITAKAMARASPPRGRAGGEGS